MKLIPAYKVLAFSVLLAYCMSAIGAAAPDADFNENSVEVKSGIVFQCASDTVPGVAIAARKFFSELEIDTNSYIETLEIEKGSLVFQLNDRRNSTNTLDILYRKDLDVKEELVHLPSGSPEGRTVVTTSRKEIVLAMLQRVRASIFSGSACKMEALVDHVGIRQNTVAWAESLDWRWPNGGAARWNKKFWSHGNLKPGRSLHAAVADAFVHPEMYAIGCYTATKLIEVQGILDYYRRIKGDMETTQRIERRLMSGDGPLTHIEPGAMWFFEEDVRPEDLQRPGKLLHLQQGVAEDNFIPGDWSYFLNTDPVTYQKTGYEGSNAIYLGRGKFDDYYNDNSHSYSYRDKLVEVYQWKHRVFSRERDAKKTQPLTAKEIDRLSKTPEKGGIELDYRAVPYHFAYESLSPLPPKP